MKYFGTSKSDDGGGGNPEFPRYKVRITDEYDRDVVRAYGVKVGNDSWAVHIAREPHAVEDMGDHFETNPALSLTVPVRYIKDIESLVAPGEPDGTNGP